MVPDRSVSIIFDDLEWP